MNHSLDFTPDTTLFKKYWLPLEQAIQRVARFERDFGKAHLTLACHAALPSILTPELVNLIRINFLEASVDWIAECDLLLSSLCQPIDQGIFEIEPQIRQVLLIALQTHLEYGPERLDEIAQFLYKYSETERVNALPSHIKRTYQWISGAYLDPDTTIQNMFDLLKDVQTDEFLSHMPDYLHIGKTLALIANPLEMTSLQVELDDLVGTAQLSTLYWTGDKENLLGLLQNTRNDDLDEITHALTKPVVNWLASSEFVTSEERSVSPLPVSQEIPVAESSAYTERKPVTIFCSYAYEDEELQRELAGYLAPLQARGLITYWHNPIVSLDESEDYKRTINEQLNTAQIILLLISADFVGSDYLYGTEMKHIMEKNEQGDVRVIPIILRSVDWLETPFGKLQSLPINAEPINNWKDRSTAFAEVVSGIGRVVEELQTLQSLHAPSILNKTRTTVQSIEIFLAYAHEDAAFLIELEKHLSPLSEQGLITTWSDRQIPAGANRRQVIDMHLERASLILLLVSPRFLMSSECSYEVQIALQLFNAYGIPVIPIILRPCMWKEAPFAGIKSLPMNDKPISIWEDRSAAIADVVDGIQHVVEQQKQKGFLERSRPRELQATPAPIEIYFVYAYDDESFFDEIYNHIYPLRQKGLITIWSDRQIPWGANMRQEIDVYLKSASLILLLVSPHFLASDDCRHKTQKALQRYQTNEVRIIPIIVRPCNWENEPFASLQVIPTHSRPITNWSNQDAAIADVADGIQHVIEDIKEPQTLPEIRDPMETGATLLPIEVFVAYAHEDEAFLIELEKYLSSLYQQGLITIWSDRQILPGAEWKQEIDIHLKRASIILLLVSPHFLTSNYSGLEMQKALERHQENEVRVMPILVQPCDWRNAPFARLPVLPTNANPIMVWSDQGGAFVDIVQGIRQVVELFKMLPEVQQRPKQLEPQSTNPPVSIDNLARPTTVFLSYARGDIDEVRDLQLRFNVRGIRCWHDVDDLPIGNQFENEIVDVIEHDVDAIIFLLTPDCLKSDFIWRVEVPAALRRYERDPHFPLVPVFQGVSFAEIRQFCYNRNLADLSNFNGILLAENEPTSTTWKEQNKKRNEVALRVLQSAFALRLRRINADRSYEPTLFLRTFVFAPPMVSLDLSLDWLKLVDEKEKISTLLNWEEILWPALLDVEHIISEKIASHRVHLFVKSILPVAIALGFVFRETTRMTLLLEKQNETWSTEAFPSEREPLRKEWIYNDQEDLEKAEALKEDDAVVIEEEEIVENEEDVIAVDEEEEVVAKEAVVEVAMSRSTRQAVAETLSTMNLLPIYHIRLEAPEFSRESVRDAAHARAIALQVGRVCQELCDERGVRHLHLFVAIPVELAILIGHQLNAPCPITLYEFKNDKRVYMPFCTLL